jgi:hypothetical protein
MIHRRSIAKEGLELIVLIDTNERETSAKVIAPFYPDPLNVNVGKSALAFDEARITGIAEKIVDVVWVGDLRNFYNDPMTAELQREPILLYHHRHPELREAA